MEFDTNGCDWKPADNPKKPRAKKRQNKEQIAKAIARANQDNLRNRQLLNEGGLSESLIPGVNSDFIQSEQDSDSDVGTQSQKNVLDLSGRTSSVFNSTMTSNESEQHIEPNVIIKNSTAVSSSAATPQNNEQSFPRPRSLKQNTMLDYFSKNLPKPKIVGVSRLDPKINLEGSKIDKSGLNAIVAEKSDKKKAETLQPKQSTILGQNHHYKFIMSVIANPVMNGSCPC